MFEPDKENLQRTSQKKIYVNVSHLEEDTISICHCSHDADVNGHNLEVTTTYLNFILIKQTKFEPAHLF